MQMPLFEPESSWAPPDLGSLPSWANAKRVSIDCETCDLHLKTLGPGVRRGAFIAGYSFAIEGGPSFYVPIRHQGGDNVDPLVALQYLRDQAKVFTGELVGANLSYDLDFLAEEGIWFGRVSRFRDIQIADPLINELHQSYSLHNIALRYGLPGKDEELLRRAAQEYGVDPKGGMWRLPARFVGRYGEVDVEQPLLILRKQEEIIEREGLQKIWDLESRVVPALVKMRRRGIRIDQGRLEGVENWSLQQETEALQKVHDLTGVHIQVGDVWRAEAFAPALDAIGAPVERTKTGKISVRKDLLDNLKHPVADALLWARKVNKLRTTFASSIRDHMTNGRIHCSFAQIAVEDEDSGGIKGARYGRMSCSNPNLQQQPSRDEFADRWRSIYIPEDDHMWATLDYSQQEPRWTTHYAEVLKLDRAFEAAERYRNDPSTDNHTMMAELTGLPRKAAKIIYLGLCYAMGGAKLCRDLNLPTRWAVTSGFGRERRITYHEHRDEARMAASEVENGRVFEAAGEEGQKILDEFNNRAPFIKKLAEYCEKRAKQKGVLITIGGRHCHFPMDANGNYDWTHKALNRLIQGSSADQTKTALVELDDAGYEMQLQVHDELDYSAPTVEHAKSAAEIMMNCIPSNVPFKVDVEVGPSWGEIKEAA